jgi:glucose-6-phosphate 1-dehydrogenase
MVIFGAAGDLTKRLLLPALSYLASAKRLPHRFQLVGVDLATKTTAEWRRGLIETVNQFVTESSGEVHVNRLDHAAWHRLTDRNDLSAR